MHERPSQPQFPHDQKPPFPQDQKPPFPQDQSRLARALALRASVHSFFLLGWVCARAYRWRRSCLGGGAALASCWATTTLARLPNSMDRSMALVSASTSIEAVLSAEISGT